MGVHLRPDRDDADDEPTEATDAEVRARFSDVDEDGATGRGVEELDR